MFFDSSITKTFQIGKKSVDKRETFR